MGSNLSSVLADIIINTLLKSMSPKSNFQLPFLVQYINDILCAFPKDLIDETSRIQ